METIFKIANILSVDAVDLITGKSHNNINTAALAQAIEAIENMLKENEEPLSFKMKAELINLKYSEILAHNLNI